MSELDPLKRRAGDISFVAQDVDGLVGLGPASSGDHPVAESVDIPSIFRQANRAALLMSRLAAQPRGKYAQTTQSFVRLGSAKRNRAALPFVTRQSLGRNRMRLSTNG